MAVVQEKTMREHPIIFRSEMIKAILEGRKTMTRRPLKVQPSHKFAIFADYRTDLGFAKSKESFWAGFWLNGTPDAGSPGYFKCPFGQLGDRLWVRETYLLHNQKDIIWYKADGGPPADDWDNRWQPSIFMSRKYSRIILEITNERVERVQDISDEDAEKEGRFKFKSNWVVNDKKMSVFGGEWDSIYGIGAWQRNDWVWVIEFKSITSAGDK